MESIIALGYVLTLICLYGLHRLQTVSPQTTTLTDDDFPINYSEEYIRTLNERVNAARLNRGDAS